MEMAVFCTWLLRDFLKQTGRLCLFRFQYKHECLKLETILLVNQPVSTVLTQLDFIAHIVAFQK